ncbi:MAG TPA: small multi-drug export protein, partial [Peptostreptococcaceae bacterium]|nr:small multi-drug export protein [Peptostreptococcaceae bacterium]
MKYILLMIMSSVPIIELRGAIPVGITWGLNLFYVYICCVIGSTLISIPLIITFRQILHELKKHKKMYKLGYFIDNKINRRMKKMKNVTILGIIPEIIFPINIPNTASLILILNIDA